MKKQIAILGSTGSIGTQALEVIEEHSDLFEVYCLTANNRVRELAEQARKFRPAAVVIANEAHYDELRTSLADLLRLGLVLRSEHGYAVAGVLVLAGRLHVHGYRN